jgi:Domain of unknown function (DUF4160)
MPTVAYFLGIAIRMFFNDHDPPHFHARYQGFSARIRIDDGTLIDGRLPPTVLRLVKEWTMLRRDALMHNWYAARNDNPLERIGGIDDD